MPNIPLTNTLKDKLILVLSDMTVGTLCLKDDGNKSNLPVCTGNHHEVELKVLRS